MFRFSNALKYHSTLHLHSVFFVINILSSFQPQQQRPSSLEMESAAQPWLYAVALSQQLSFRVLREIITIYGMPFSARARAR